MEGLKELRFDVKRHRKEISSPQQRIRPAYEPDPEDRHNSLLP